MLVAVLAFIVSAVTVDLAGYWLHRWSHRKGSPLYRPHMVHHVVNYPPRRFFSQHYVSAGVNNLALWFAPFGLLYVVAVVWLGLPHTWAIVAGGATVAVLSSVAHDLTHLEGSIVWRNRVLLGIAVRHHAHHFKMSRNFGILSPAWDLLFRTRREAPSRSARP